ncbi:MAG: hypothetical protein ACRC80_01720 [Waterburya sp.]
MDNKIDLANQTNDSFLIDVDLDEAADVNGGDNGGFYSYEGTMYVLDGYLTSSSYYLSQNPNKYAYSEPSFNSIDDIDRRVGGILSTLRYL